MLAVLAAIAIQATNVPVYVINVKEYAIDVAAPSQEQALKYLQPALDEQINSTAGSGPLSQLGEEVGKVLWQGGKCNREIWYVSLTPPKKSDQFATPSYDTWKAKANATTAAPSVIYHLGYNPLQSIPVCNTYSPDYNANWLPRRCYIFGVTTYVWYYSADKATTALALAYAEWISGGVYSLKKPLTWEDQLKYGTDPTAYSLPSRKWIALIQLTCEPGKAMTPGSYCYIGSSPYPKNPLYDWRDRTWEMPFTGV